MKQLETHAYFTQKSSLLSPVCKATGQWGLFLSVFIESEQQTKEVGKAAAYLNHDQVEQLIDDGFLILLFNQEEEMLKAYEMTVGDHGPTSLNHYNGLFGVYALSCDKKGELLNDNKK